MEEDEIKGACMTAGILWRARRIENWDRFVLGISSRLGKKGQPGPISAF